MARGCGDVLCATSVCTAPKAKVSARFALCFLLQSTLGRWGTLLTYLFISYYVPLCVSGIDKRSLLKLQIMFDHSSFYI